MEARFHCSRRSKQLDLRSLQTRFNFVKGAVSTNLLTKRGLGNALETIKLLTNQLPHIGAELPKAFVDLRRELERLAQSKDYISLEEYYGICASFSISEPESALYWSDHLHDLGILLHFQQDRFLKNILILNNQWITDAVYDLLNYEPVKSAFGCFTHEDLMSIWRDKRYVKKHDELLALMVKFELCYKLQHEKTETWLAPQLLPASQPDSFDWKAADDIQLWYEYEFMPKGLLSQLIVRMHRYVQEPELAWAKGVVFERSSSLALVTENWERTKISIRAQGFQAKELLTLISEDLDMINARLKGLKVKKMIPCNCGECKQAHEPHFYDHGDLIRRVSKGILIVECGISYEKMSVAGLLDGVFVESKNTMSKKVVISYSPEDEASMEELKKFLRPLQRERDFKIWTAKEILPGQNWKNEILQQLESADIILLLVSANFLNSDFIHEEEIPRAFQRMKEHRKPVVPILLNYSRWKETPLSKLQATPKKPIADYSNRDQAWDEVAMGILALLNA